MVQETDRTVQLPSVERSLQYFDDYKVPGNIKAHCLRVRDVSRFLAEHLFQSGQDINVDFTDRLGMFHDLFKAVALSELRPNRFHSYVHTPEEVAMWKKLRQQYPGMYEGDVAYIVFKEDFPELALALKKVCNPRETDLSWEEKIVHYADWRVFQDSIVSIAERLVYLREIYPRTDGAWSLFEQKIKSLEQDIFSKLPFSPEELKEILTPPESEQVA